MKIKSDFVTNSSTSCYVIVGYQIPDQDGDTKSIRRKIMTQIFGKEYDEEEYWDLRWSGTETDLQVYDDDEIFIGKTVMSFDDEGGEITKADVASLIELLNVEELFITSFIDKVKENKKLKRKAGEIEVDLRNALIEIKSRYEIEESSFEDGFEKVRSVFNIEGPPKIISMIQNS